MARLGRFSVSASLLAALLALPCVCQAAEYEEPTQLCHDRAEGAYQVAVAKGDALPDGEYESELAFCQWESYRARLVADPKVSLRELVEFDWTDADDGRLGVWN